MTAFTGVAGIRVHPGIGVGRVGNSVPTASGDRGYFFLGPETPDEAPNPGGGDYRDAQGRIKRQAQRFRLFAYDAQGQVLGEVVAGDSVNGTVVGVQWTVHVANMKAANYCFQGQYGFDAAQLRNSGVQPGLSPQDRDQLIVDPGPITIEGTSQGPVELLDEEGSTIFGGIGSPVALSALLSFDPPQQVPPSSTVEVTYRPVQVSLGALYTDENGRLIVVGGSGQAGSATTPAVVISKVTEGNDPNPEYNGNSYFNNPGWYDDTCGGSIDAALVDAGGQTLLSTVGNAGATGWIVVAPPKYAPASYTVVSLLDLQLDLFPASDPYTGRGPLVLGAVEAGGTAALGSSEQGTVSELAALQPIGATSKLAPAVTVFAGSIYYATIGSDGVPMIGSAPLGGPVKVELAPAGPASTPATSLAPALAVYQDQLFYAFVASDGTPYLGASPSGQAGSFAFLAAGATGLASTGPALAAWNGALYYAFGANPDLDPTGEKRPLTQLGSSTTPTSPPQTGPPVDFGFRVVGDNAFTPYSPALAVFQGQLYLAFTGGNGLPYLGSGGTALAPQDFPLTQLDSFTSSTGPALAAFNGTLLYAAAEQGGTLQLGASSDGTTFTFASGPGGTQLSGLALATYQPVSFYRDVFPILELVTDYAWINERAFHGHRPGTQGDFLRQPFLGLLAEPGAAGGEARRFVFDFLRPPAQPTPLVPPPPQSVDPGDIPPALQQRGDLMPRLFGNGGSPEENADNGTDFPNQWLSLTNHQLGKLQRWVNGDFVAGTRGKPRWRGLAVPEALDFAALQPTVGGGFHPGIELTYLMHEPTFFSGPFRFAAGTVPGSIAAYMSVPWQGDFWSCNVSWWPPARPDITVVRHLENEPVLLTAQPWFRGNVIPPFADSIDGYEDGYQSMADNWTRFGFVVPVPEAADQGERVFHEVERDPTLDGPSILASVVSGQPSGMVLAVVIAQVGLGTGTGTPEQWQLEPYTGSPTYFFVRSVSTSLVLTAGFAAGSAVGLSARASPSQDSQLWSYVHLVGTAPGVFYLVSKINGNALTIANGKAVTSSYPAGSPDRQQWLLQAP